MILCCSVLIKTFWRRRFGAAGLAPTCLALRSFGAIVLAPVLFGAWMFWRQDHLAPTYLALVDLALINFTLALLLQE